MSILPPPGTYTTLREDDSVAAMSRAASMRFTSIMAGPFALSAAEMSSAASPSPCGE